jgi:hypothetical protein
MGYLRDVMDHCCGSDSQVSLVIRRVRAPEIGSPNSHRQVYEDRPTRLTRL